MTQHYDVDEGGVRFVSQRRPGEVRIPNYIYDMWMPLVGSDAIGVYSVYCRLERKGTVKAMSMKTLAQRCRIGIKKLEKINAALVECGFVTITKPKGYKRLMHWTTEVEILDPPKEVTQVLIDKYAPPSGYKILTPWLSLPEDPNGSSGDAKQVIGSAPNESSKVAPSYVVPSVVEKDAATPPSLSAPDVWRDPLSGLTREEKDMSQEEAQALSSGGLTEALPVKNTPKEPTLTKEWRIEEIDMIDGITETATCPACDESLVVADLSKSAATCPVCDAGLKVIGPTGTLYKPPQRMRKKKSRNSVGTMKPALDAFCAGLRRPTASVPFRDRMHWAKKLKEHGATAVEGESFTPAEIARAIEALGEFYQYWTTPFNRSFGDALKRQLYLQSTENATTLVIKPGEWKP